MDEALTAEDVYKSYGRQAVLSGVSLRARAGELVLIRGENGVGKTTLLRVLAGREAPDAGTVAARGRGLSSGKGILPHLSLSRPRHFPVRAPQSPRAFSELTVSECFNLVGGGPSDPGRRAFGHELEKPAGSLSGGRRKALSVAMAFATGAEVVMLDEPEAGLDAANVDRLVQILASAKSAGRAIVVSAHQPSVRLAELADKIYWMYEGRLHHAPPGGAAAERGGRVDLQRARHEWSPAGLLVHNLTVSRGGTTVLENVSLALEPGSALCVTGPNGSGKSSLALALAGMIPSQGEVEVEGAPVSHLPPHRRSELGISLVPQFPHGVFTELTVDENLRAAARARPPMALFPELYELGGRQARVLSGGLQRLLAIAVALERGGRLLIIDEPLSGLGDAAAGKVLDTLALLKGRVTVLAFEHRSGMMSAAGLQVVEISGLCGRDRG